jgi:elongation factor P
MISVNDFRTGVSVEIEGNLYTVVDFQHVKPGKGSAFVRSKLKNVKTGYVVEKTFRAGEKLKRAHIERRQMQFLYAVDEDYTFMDNESYEQITIPAVLIGDQTKWLKEGNSVQVLFHEANPLGVEIPAFVELKVTQTEPGFKGDTTSGGNKPATVETGATIQVPLFINIGDVLQIDTRTNTYLKRV